MIIATSSFSESFAFKMFSIHTKSFEKLRFYDGLVWTEDLNMQRKKAAFSNRMDRALVLQNVLLC